MKHTHTRTLYEYWNRLRAGERAPRRDAIEPAAIRAVLGDTFLLESIDPNTYLFRLAGTRLCNLYCRELRGENYLSMWPDEDREAFATMLAAVTEDAAVASFGIEVANDRDQRLLCEGVIVPLRHQGPNCDRALGAICPVEQPYWLGVQPIKSQKITTLRLLWPDEHQPALAPQLVSAEGAKRPSFVPRRERPSRHGAFVVYEGGRR